MPMNVLVCGGRDFSDVSCVYKTLDRLAAWNGGISTVIQGYASGADAIARAWAADRKVPCCGAVAAWDEHGRSAGPIRNQAMLDDFDVDCVVASPGGRGTHDMVKRARRAGLMVLMVSMKGNLPEISRDSCAST